MESEATGLKMLWRTITEKANEGLKKQTFGFTLLLFVVIGLVSAGKIVVSYYDRQISKLEERMDKVEASDQKSKKELTTVLRHELTTSSAVIQRSNELQGRTIEFMEKINDKLN